MNRLTQLLALLVLGGLLVLSASSIACGSWSEGRAPFPYIWRDVALVHLLCAVPLAWVVGVFLLRSLSGSAAVGLAVIVLTASVVPFFDSMRADLLSACVSSPSLGIVLRAAPAFGLTLSGVLAAIVLAGGQPERSQRERWETMAVAGVGTVVLMLIPWTYVNARCRHDVAQLGELLEQSRFGEARQLVHALLALDAHRTWKKYPLERVARELDQDVGAVEASVAVPLAAEATPDERLERGRQLAILGRTAEAIAVLHSVTEPTTAPEVENLRGTIYETTGEWESALGAYQRAREAWKARPSSPAQAAGLLRATTGVAYCQRKMGRYADAEATYQQVLALSPSGASHFLLAQFYEDTQQADKARKHARQAIALDPVQYQQDGDRLINKLSVYHFGCLGVYRAENERSGKSLAPGRSLEKP